MRKVTNKPSNEELLEVSQLKYLALINANFSKLYALFKQATVGDNETEAPGTFDFKGKAKYNAWNTKKGISQADAEAQYIAYAEKVIANNK